MILTTNDLMLVIIFAAWFIELFVVVLSFITISFTTNTFIIGIIAVHTLVPRFFKDQRPSFLQEFDVPLPRVIVRFVCARVLSSFASLNVVESQQQLNFLGALFTYMC
jgi:hypothetical protein